jgi:TolA-binding protein
LPTVTITDEPDRNRTSRKLVVRFDVPTRFTVRAGKTNRIIEVVLDGLGTPARSAALRPVPAAAPQASSQQYLIVLQRGPSPINMDKPLPKALGDVELRNAARVVQGKTEYELTIGPFKTMDEARAALRLLTAFPEAQITEQRPAAVAQAPAPAATVPAGTAAPTSATAPAAAAAAAAQTAAPASTGPQDPRGRELLAQAKAAQARGDDSAAVALLDELLNLPPTTSTREAQALIGELRFKLGDIARARAEFQTFLSLFPEGPDAQRVREKLASLPAPVVAKVEPDKKPTSTTTWTGSWAQTYYGGQSKTQTLLKQITEGTPAEGQLQQVVTDSTISGTDQKQVQTGVDVGWRYRDADQDLRFMFRDAQTTDLMPNRPDKNKVTALYVDYKQVATGLSARLGRQSGLGGGVLGRFDGALFGWAYKPKWKLSAVAGVPTDSLLDAKRHFYGVSLDADALMPALGGSVYAIQQVIDGRLDRRALGNELRYVKPNATVFTVLEYDVALKGLNVASAQGLFTTEGNTSINLMADRRATPLLMLGNALFFTPTGGASPRNISDLLGMQTMEEAKRYVTSTTAYMTQASASFTTPINAHWQAGADLRLVNVGALAPVAEIPELAQGRQGTGNLWTLGVQAIGTNLYSPRDTHVLMASAVSGPDLSGWLASYNNMSVPWERWQLEPSLRLYQQKTKSTSGQTSRITPGFRVSYKVTQNWSIESDLSVEFSRTRGPNQDESGHRISYSLGYRYDH